LANASHCTPPSLDATPSSLWDASFRTKLPTVTPHIQNYLYGPTLHVEWACICVAPRGVGLHMCSTSLILSSSLRVKGLTQRCYVWNDKAYKLALTLLNFQGGTKPTNNNTTCATWAT
jgi:hypothetical protein